MNGLVWLAVVVLLLTSYRYLEIAESPAASIMRLPCLRNAACTSWRAAQISSHSLSASNSPR